MTAPSVVAMPTPADPFVRVVVLNWNAAWFTRRCLRALERTDYPADRWEVVLVDNGSVDGSLQQLRWSFPGLRIIANATNLGFAEGCNRGMRDRAGVDHIALVNNDAVVEPGWLRPLVDALAADPGVGAASARLVLEPGFVPVDVRADGGVVAFRSAAVDGLEVTGGVRPDGFVAVPALDWPLDLTQELRGGAGRLWVPAGPGAGSMTLAFDGTGAVTVAGGPAAPTTVAVPGSATLPVGDDRDLLLNAVGTALNDLGEGYDLHYGEVDHDQVEPGDVDGFCGGGALLRGDMLDQVGLFDPAYFAYYEDTDLSWRARRAGWRIVGVPSSVIHHAFGASAGSRARGFYFLDRRNWWLTTERNGSEAQRAVVRSTARRSFTKAVRANVVGRVRRLKRPRFELVATWARVVLAVRVGRRRLHRAGGRSPVGARPADRVRSRFQPAPVPRPPSARPGGPLIVYVDVTDTLRSGWRAGIQRAVRGFVAHLPDADASVELVPVVHVGGPDRFRRVDSGEYASLLAPAPPALPASPEPAPSALRHTAVAAVDLAGLGDMARRARRRDAGGGGADGVDPALVLDRLQPGAVFLDLDAVWNADGVDRARLLQRVRADGVRIVPFVHDVLPTEHPEWFVPELVDSFDRTLRAQLGAADLVLTNSRHTERAVAALAAGLGRPDLAVRAVGLGADPVGPPAAGVTVPAGLRNTRYLLVVGTIEPRKNQALVLDAFARVVAELDDDTDDVHLVVVGRSGWHADDVVERLRRSGPGRRVHWFRTVDDDTLDALYRSAFLVLVPSVTEGYGLPLVEAMARGAAVVSSPGGALAEVGDGVADLVPVDDPGAWADVVLRHLRDPGVHDAAVARSRSRTPRTWADAATELAAALHSVVDQGRSSRVQ